MNNVGLYEEYESYNDSGGTTEEEGNSDGLPDGTSWTRRDTEQTLGVSDTEHIGL